LGIRHPEIFHTLADHSGDAAFEYKYLPDFPKALMLLEKQVEPKKWLDNLWKNLIATKKMMDLH